MSLVFAPHLNALGLDGSGLALLSEDGCDVFPGLAFAQLADLLDGSRSEEEVLAACQAGPEEVAAAIAQLRRTGAVLDRPSGAATGADAGWWSSQLVAAAPGQANLEQSAVSVRALGQVDPAPTIDALTRAGVQVTPSASRGIVLVEDYLDDGLQERNAAALQDGRPWLLGSPQGARVLVGPAFSPDEGPCWECLASRLRQKRQVRWHLGAMAGVLDAVPAPPRLIPPETQHGLGPALVATQALRWLTGSAAGMEATILSFDSRGWTSEQHHVVWRPQCPACGVAEAALDRSAAPIRLRKSGHRPEPGGLRTVPSAATFDRFSSHVSAISGAVDALVKVPSPAGLHVYAAPDRAIRINGDRQGWEFLTGMDSSGKGMTEDAARTSALCEALERYSGIFDGSEPRREATFGDLGEAAIAPNDYMRFSERQFDDREALNASAESFRTYVPERLDPEARIAWSPVWSLTHNCERLMPTALCYFGAHAPGAEYCVGESNGNAAGNTLEEAILHGLLELVERDHVALWWYNRTPLPGIDLDTIDEPWLQGFRDHLSRNQRNLWALDLTADLGIPMVACLVASPDGGNVGMGFGAHLDLRGAALRAATELVQLGFGGTSGGMGSGADTGLHLDNHAFARPDPARPLRSLAGAPAEMSAVAEGLSLCQTAIEAAGLEVLVVDQTRPDIGLPVVKTVVPGLRHFWPRFGPGRLYDVPVALGRLDEPRREHELNPENPVT